jgi:hypothetical protein
MDLRQGARLADETGVSGRTRRLLRKTARARSSEQHRIESTLDLGDILILLLKNFGLLIVHWHRRVCLEHHDPTIAV